MPKPKYETWFMEGKLVKDFHYIEVETTSLTQKENTFLWRKY